MEKKISLLQPTNEEYAKLDSDLQKFLKERNVTLVATPRYAPCDKELGAKTVCDINFLKIVETGTNEKDNANVPSPFVSPEPAS